MWFIEDTAVSSVFGVSLKLMLWDSQVKLPNQASEPAALPNSRDPALLQSSQPPSGQRAGLAPIAPNVRMGLLLLKHSICWGTSSSKYQKTQLREV